MNTVALPRVADKYNLGAPAQTAPDSQLPVIAGPGEVDHTATKLWHPDSPLFWFGVLAAATFGLMAVSTSVRVGPASASLSLDKK